MKLLKLLFKPLTWLLSLFGIGGGSALEEAAEQLSGGDSPELPSVGDVVSDGIKASKEPSPAADRQPTQQSTAPAAPPSRSAPVSTPAANSAPVASPTSTAPASAGGSRSPYGQGRTEFNARVSKLGGRISELSGLPGAACSVGARVIHDYIGGFESFTYTRIGVFSSDGRGGNRTFRGSKVLRDWLLSSYGSGAKWAHAMAEEEVHRIRYWAGAAGKGLGSNLKGQVDGLSTRRQIAWALHKGSGMSLKWAVRMTRAWELAITEALLRDGRVQLGGLGHIRSHKVDAASGNSAYVKLTLSSRRDRQFA